MRDAAPPRIGRRYALLDRIATGGMGEVWRARDERLDRLVAVKLLKPEYAEDPTFLTRFRNEARHTAALTHPGIAGVYDYGDGADGEPPYLVMELVDAEPLSRRLARDGPLPPQMALEIVGQVSLALQAAHDAGVIHRDVKPGNILVSDVGGGLTVKVTDFGIARAVDAVPITGTGQVLGTSYYLSPEQASGAPLSPASDVYSLGIVAYECLTGRRPFDDDNPLAVAHAHVHAPPPPLPGTIPTDVRELVAATLAKDPRTRPESAGAFGRWALQLANGAATTQPTRPLPVSQADGPAATRRLPPATRTPRRPRRGRPARLVALLLVLGLMAALAVALSRRSNDPAAARPGPAASPALTTRPSPRPSATVAATVQVSRNTYVGRPAAEVAAALRRLGLAVREERKPGRAPGTVLDIAPTGAVARGTTVTLVVASPTKHGDKGHRKKKKHGN